MIVSLLVAFRGAKGDNTTEWGTIQFRHRTLGQSMGKKRGVEAKLARPDALREEPVSSAIIAELRKSLGDASNLVAAEAAAIIGKAKLVDFAPDLAAAFDRFMIEPEATDKICRAKIA